MNLAEYKDKLRNLGEAIENYEGADSNIEVFGRILQDYSEELPDVITVVEGVLNTCRDLHWIYLTPVAPAKVLRAQAEENIEQLVEWQLMSASLDEEIVKVGVFREIPTPDQPDWSSRLLIQAVFSGDEIVNFS